jgi:hypothetical protein
MAWIIHHLDTLEYYPFQYSRTYLLRAAAPYSARRSNPSQRGWGLQGRYRTVNARRLVLVRAMSAKAYLTLSQAWTSR